MVTQWFFLTFPPFSCGKMGKIIVPDGKKNQNRTLFFPIWNIFSQFFQVQHFKETMKFQIRAIYWG